MVSSGLRLRDIKKGKKKVFFTGNACPRDMNPNPDGLKTNSEGRLAAVQISSFPSDVFCAWTNRVYRARTGKMRIVITNSDDEQLRKKNPLVVNRRFPLKLLWQTIWNVYVQNVNTNYFIIYSRHTPYNTTAVTGKFILILTFSRIRANRAHRVNGRVYFCFFFFFSKKKKKKNTLRIYKTRQCDPISCFCIFFICHSKRLFPVFFYLRRLHFKTDKSWKWL